MGISSEPSRPKKVTFTEAVRKTFEMVYSNSEYFAKKIAISSGHPSK